MQHHHTPLAPRTAPIGRLPILSLLILSSGIFLSQTAEFLPGGLLPRIADDLALEVGLAGQMISVFAFTVVLTTAPLALLTRRFDRKALVVVTLGVVSASNAVVALAPTFEGVLAGRIVGALAHGLFWAIVATYTVEIVPREKLGRAMAFTAAGGSLAGILGAPIGNALGEAFGWRLSFIAVSGTGAVVTLALWRWLPRIANAPSRRTRSKARAPWDRSVAGIALICALILVLVLGQTSFGPYTTLWLEEIAGFDRGAVPAYLLITGVAGAVGAVFAGHLYDRHPRTTFAGSCALLTASLCAYPLAEGGGFSISLTAVAILSSVGFAGLPVMLQTRMMQTASPRMRRLAGAVQTTVFNVGIGGGAVIGGLIVSGVGVQALPWLAATSAALTGGFALIWDVVRRRAPADDPLSTPEALGNHDSAGDDLIEKAEWTISSTGTIHLPDR